MSQGGCAPLVTGSAGFLGGLIAQALGAVGFDRGPATFRGDIGRVADILPADFRPHTIVHAAAITTQASEADPEAAFAINVQGTRALLAWAKSRPVPPRLVLLSSVGVFGGGAAAPDEHSRLAPASVYGTTKAMAEWAVLDAARRGEVDGVVLRLPICLLRTTRQGPPGAGFLSDLVDHARRGLPFTAPLAADVALPVASVRVAIALACRAALARDLPARVLHVPSLSVSGQDALAALGGAPLVSFRPDPAVQRLIAGWPRRLATAYPAFSEDLRDAGFAAILAGAGAA